MKYAVSVGKKPKGSQKVRKSEQIKTRVKLNQSDVTTLDVMMSLVLLFRKEGFSVKFSIEK